MNEMFSDKRLRQVKEKQQQLLDTHSL